MLLVPARGEQEEPVREERGQPAPPPSPAAALPLAPGARAEPALKEPSAGEGTPSGNSSSSIAFVSAHSLHFEQLEALSPGWRGPSFLPKRRNKNGEIGIRADIVLLVPSVLPQLYTTPVCSECPSSTPHQQNRAARWASYGPSAGFVQWDQSWQHNDRIPQQTEY